ncbi:PREDICTED: uncharacterized protein LOC106819214 [Priapulus caudatus]|uniref:Uncharacterized protein LOC106819214 n=1 Tax=Priapulus caudatus TaxID=37621 RepID=A0ABM1F4H6_PRICU|nr:PREDICTED: uncharacterized protein LOC106819214 [Priapulus caudatus]
MYATAAVIAGETKERVTKPTEEPTWKKKIRTKIENHRKGLFILSEIKSVTTKQVHAKARSILCKSRRENKTICELEQERKMKLQAKAQRLRRFTKQSEHYYQNKLFHKDAKKFYWHLNEQQSTINEPPSQERLDQFWRGILEVSTDHNTKATWIKQEEEAFQNVAMDVWTDITMGEVQQAIKRTHNWKSPGPDKLHNFWIKHLSALHKQLTRALNDTIKDPSNSPKWLTSGTTFFISKGKDTKEPKNYRPIT